MNSEDQLRDALRASMDINGDERKQKGDRELMDEHTKHLFDIAAITAAIASLAAWLPPIAALLSIVWTLLRIYESNTVQKLLGRK